LHGPISDSDNLVTIAERIFDAIANRPAVKRWACREDRRQSVKAEPAQTAATLRLLNPSDGTGITLTEYDALRPPIFIRQPYEIDDYEPIIDRRTGKTWIFTGAEFIRTPDADVDPEESFGADV
jgi:hypothetical protein